MNVISDKGGRTYLPFNEFTTVGLGCEVEVFEIELNGDRIAEDVLRQMDRQIPYHILFAWSFENRVQAWIGYKEAVESGTAAFKVERYYHTDWMPRESLRFTIDGLDMDTVYESLVRQIGGAALRTAQTDESMKESVSRDAERTRVEKQIAALETKLRKERQFNRQMELNAQIRRLKKELARWEFSPLIVSNRGG